MSYLSYVMTSLMDCEGLTENDKIRAMQYFILPSSQHYEYLSPVRIALEACKTPKEITMVLRGVIFGLNPEFTFDTEYTVVD